MSPVTAIRTAHASPRATRVMVVDDSAVVRGLLSRWIGEAGHLEVVATAGNGREALGLVGPAAPDIVLLDLDMPEMDGVETLPLLLRARPTLSVIVVSTLTPRNAEMSLRCLRLGAIDCIPKPGGPREVSLATTFRAELLAKLHGLSLRSELSEGGHGTAFRPSSSGLRPVQAPRALAIGASTGGPRAVIEVVKGLGARARALPVFVVQHMPPIFTTVFAQQIAAETGLQAHEARHGEPVTPGEILVAPGGRHLGLAVRDGEVRVRLDDTPPIHHCRPSVDLLLREAAAIYGSRMLGIILTGMGSDGLDGSRAVVAAGGTILAQDQATSVVWGMPGSVAKAGLASDVLPLGALAAAVEGRCGPRPAGRG